MKYKVVGIYKHEAVVDTEDEFYKQWRKSWRGRDYKDEKDAVERYVQDFLGYQIIDDEGHGTLTPGSLEWTVEEETK